MANDFLDYLSEQEQGRYPASGMLPPTVVKGSNPDPNGGFKGWLMGEEMGAPPVTPAPVIPVVQKRVSTPIANTPVQEIPQAQSFSTTGATPESIAVFDKAIAKSAQVEKTVKDAVEKRQREIDSQQPLQKVDYYTPALDVEDIIKGKQGQPGLNQKVKEYNEILNAGLTREEEIKAETEPKIIAAQNEIEKNDAAKIKFHEDQLNSQPAESTIDQGRVWSNASLGSKVLMAIGLALSANSNTAMTNSVKVINDTIERDIEEQKYNNAQEALGRKTKEGKKLNLFDAYDRMYKNKIQAAQGLRAKHWAEVEKLLNSKTSEIKNQSMLLNAQQLNSIVQQTANKHTQDLYNQIRKSSEDQKQESLKNNITLATSQLNTAKLLVDKAQAMKQSLSIKQGGVGAGTKQMSSTDKKRYDDVTMSILGLDKMAQALNKGDNTFNVVGDSDYTFGKKLFTEAFGRLQSQGAINKDELVSFKNLAPNVKDKKNIQLMKLATMKQILQGRLKTLGIGTTQGQATMGPTETKEIKRY